MSRPNPLYPHACGQGWLAHNPKAVEATHRLTLRRWTPQTITDHADLVVELTKVRRDGVAYEHGESRIGLTCVAVPVMGADSRPVAAVSIAGATGRFDPRRHAEALRRAGCAASRAL